MRHFGRQKDIRKREQKVPLTQMPLIKQKQNSKVLYNRFRLKIGIITVMETLNFAKDIFAFYKPKRM